jgi:hypothetical protein
MKERGKNRKEKQEELFFIYFLKFLLHCVERGKKELKIWKKFYK